MGNSRSSSFSSYKRKETTDHYSWGNSYLHCFSWPFPICKRINWNFSPHFTNYHLNRKKTSKSIRVVDLEEKQGQCDRFWHKTRVCAIWWCPTQKDERYVLPLNMLFYYVIMNISIKLIVLVGHMWRKSQTQAFLYHSIIVRAYPPIWRFLTFLGKGKRGNFTPLKKSLAVNTDLILIIMNNICD